MMVPTIQKIQPIGIIQRTDNQGFTLLELMVALVIFAMLSLAGWQIFDGLNKAKDRAKLHANALSDLQYAYLQVQNDLNQVVAWQTIHLNQSTNGKNTNKNGSNDATEIVPFSAVDFFEMSPTSLSFIRFADADPRYQVSPTLVRVEYLLADNNFIRRQYLSAEANTTSIDSVLLTDVESLNWQAFLPEPVPTFSAQAIAENSQANQNSQFNQNNQANNNKQIQLLPKGVGVQFAHRSEDIEWLFALPNSSPALISNYDMAVQSNDKTGSPDSTRKQTGTDKGSDDSVKKDSGSDSPSSKESGLDFEDIDGSDEN